MHAALLNFSLLCGQPPTQQAALAARLVRFACVRASVRATRVIRRLIHPNF
jgi:hypothetical protein